MEMISEGDLLVNETMKVSIDNEYITIDNRYYKRTLKISSIFKTEVIEDLLFISLQGGPDLIIPFYAAKDVDIEKLKEIFFFK